MLELTGLRRTWYVAVLLLGISASAFAGSVSITFPSNLALFQHTNGAADIPVTAVVTGVPSGGGVMFILDANTSKEVSGVSLSSPYSYTFQTIGLGEHTVDAYMVDSTGNQTGPHDSLSRVGVGDLIVCVGDSITAGEDDDITSDDWSADGRNGPHVDPVDGLSFGGFEPILNNLLTAARGYPHSVINEGLGAETSAGGLQRLPGIIAQYPTANTWLIAYGTNDIHQGMSVRTFESNLAKMFDLIKGTNPDAVVYMPKILYGGQSNIGTYLDFMGNLIYYTGGMHWGADMYTMFQHNLDTYDRMSAQTGTWYAVDPVPHPNGLGYQVIAKLWELAMVDNAFIVADGTASIVGRIWADKLQLTGVDKIGLSANNLLLVSAQPPTQPIPRGTSYADGGWSVYLGLTGANDFHGGSLSAIVRLEPWDLFNSGTSSWRNIILSSGSMLLPTTRSVFSGNSDDEDFTARIMRVGQFVPVAR